MNISILNIRKSRFSKIAPIWTLGILGNGCFLAGGAMRTLLVDEEVADFDLFFTEKPFEEKQKELSIEINFETTSEEAKKEFVYSARVSQVKDTLEREKFKLIFFCPEGKLLTYKKGSIKIQLVLEAWGHPEEVISSFDFNATKAAFDGEKVFIAREFIKDVKTKKLSINLITYPVSTIKRLIKYSNKGYNVNDACIQFMRQVSGIVFNEENLRLYID